MATPSSRGTTSAFQTTRTGAATRQRFIDAAVEYLLGEHEPPAARVGRRSTTTQGGAGRSELSLRSPGTLGIRLVAQLAGTTHAAPLYYFPDRTCLLAAVAAEGFRRLLAALEEGSARPSGGGRSKVPAVLGDALSYVQWAGDHPALFTAMYEPELAADLELLQRAALLGASPADAFGERHGGDARSISRRVEAYEELLEAKVATLTFFSGRVANAISAGSLRGDQPAERVVYALTSMADGLAWQRITERQASAHLLDSHARSCLTLLFEGIRGNSQ